MQVLVALKQAMVAAPRSSSESFLLHEGSKQLCCSTNALLDELDDLVSCLFAYLLFQTLFHDKTFQDKTLSIRFSLSCFVQLVKC